MKVVNKQTTKTPRTLAEFLAEKLPSIRCRVDDSGKHPAVFEAKVFTHMLEFNRVHPAAPDPAEWVVIGGLDARDEYTIVLYEKELLLKFTDLAQIYETIENEHTEVTIELADKP